MSVFMEESGKRCFTGVRVLVEINIDGKKIPSLASPLLTPPIATVAPTFSLVPYSWISIIPKSYFIIISFFIFLHKIQFTPLVFPSIQS
ncbi:hypothetical protein L6452_14427 [Arctium lappa]|uniref:Uncharacterized protein n=1 Tax=Arctium lappa TaxID=4217 RepID=A0ACB9CL86_ARCLA|nr:hypothetical protein L6452_14427 [Arctium lappa]